MTNDNDLIRRGDVQAIPMLGMTVTAIEKAIAALPAVTPAVGVKPLVWTLMPDSDFTTYKASSVVGPYYVRATSYGGTAWRRGMVGEWKHISSIEADNSLNTSKAAAQADYEARILAAITLTPTPVAASQAADPVVKLITAAQAMVDHLETWRATGTVATPDKSKALYDGLVAGLQAVAG